MCVVCVYVNSVCGDGRGVFMYRVCVESICGLFVFGWCVC